MAELQMLRIVPGNEATWDDLQRVLSGTAARCQCQRQRLGDRAWYPMPVEARTERLRIETACEDPTALETSGIVAYVGEEPAGWCAVDSRPSFARLRGSPVPWKGRSEDRDDPTVWAVACLVVRKGYRGEGLTYELVRAAVEHARERGARAIEGYPMVTDGKQVIWDEMSVGAVGPFLEAGFREVSRPTVRRVVMRRELA